MESTFRDTCPRDLKVIETFGAGPAGPRDWAAHRARLVATCAALGISPDMDKIDAVVAGMTAVNPLRVRLTVDLDGTPHVDAVPLGPQAPVWRIGLSATVIDENDPWYTIKTTQRDVYDHARASLPATLDEVIFTNRKGHITEGTITNIFVQKNGILYTPPVNDGVLPGILRGRMIEDGRAEVAHLTWDDVVDASHVYVGNALRGLLRAEI